jgi:hypothetical protein
MALCGGTFCILFFCSRARFFHGANFTTLSFFAAAFSLFNPAPKLSFLHIAKLTKYSMDLNNGHAVFDLNNGRPSLLSMDFPFAFGLLSFPLSYYL